MYSCFRYEREPGEIERPPRLSTTYHTDYTFYGSQSATTIGSGILMTGRAHSNQIAERIRPTSYSVVSFPVGRSEPVGAPSTSVVVLTHTHGAFTATTGTSVKRLSYRLRNRHQITSFHVLKVDVIPAAIVGVIPREL